MAAAPLRWTGLEKVVSFYRYCAFNVPKTTTGVGVALLLSTAAIQGFLLARHFTVPAYLVGWFILMIAGSLLASAAMTTGSAPRLVRSGWALGSAVSLLSLAIYLVSRGPGLPGLPQMVGKWHYPLGNVSVVIALLFLALHFSVLTGMNVAYPQRRHWHD